MSPLFPIPVTTTRPRQPNISSSARLKSDAIGPASRSASARKASASMRTTFSPTCFMEREMLAEAAEHRVIGSSILSTAFRQTITFLSWAHCVKIHGPQETRGMVRCRESGWIRQPGRSGLAAAGSVPGFGPKSALGGCSGTRVQLAPTCDFNAGPEPIRDFYLYQHEL